MISACREGELCGEGRVVLEGGDWLEVTYRQGAVHGLVRRRSSAGRVLWVGRYCRGRQRGGAWHFQPGGGVITGPGDTSTYTVTGDQATYLYPDLATCLTGTFSQSSLVTATQARITGIAHTDTGVGAVHASCHLHSACQGIAMVTTEPVCPVPRVVVPPDQFWAGAGLLLGDPYEEATVEVRPSSLAMAGQGVFLRRDVGPGTVVAFYHGVRLADTADTEGWEDCSYRIFMRRRCGEDCSDDDDDDDDDDDVDVLDIPPELRAVDRYCATLAHKINHSFRPNCRSAECYLPRRGC